MLVVGLTGGIATGKSTASTLLRAANVPVIDADIIARQVVGPGTPALAKIKATFGDQVILPDGTLDRKKLGNIIFNNEGKRKQLDKIVHPAIRWEMFLQVLGYWVRGHKYCVLDVPLLVESGLYQWVGQVVMIYCSQEVQLRRLMERDNCTKEEALARINSQIPITEKCPFGNIFVDNSSTTSQFETHIKLLMQQLDRVAGWSWRLSWFPPFALLSAGWTLLMNRLPPRVPEDAEKKT